MPIKNPALALPCMVLEDDAVMVKHVKKFHEWMYLHVNKYSVVTLRKSAWQLHMFYEDNKKFRDVEFIKPIIEFIEFIIQKKSNSNWTIKKAKTDMRGRFSSRYSRIPKQIPIPQDLSKALRERVLQTEVELEKITHRKGRNSIPE